MVKLIYGDIGSGKSEYILSCLEKDAREGVSAILIVPEQQTVAAERELLERLPASAQLNIEVLNFSRLANRVFRRTGGLIYNYASAGQRTLMRWRALCQCAPMLCEYHDRASSDRSLPATMLSISKELSSSGISPDGLELFCKDMPDSTLRRKLSDIATVSAAYRLLLSQSHADPTSDLDRLCEMLDTSARGYFSGMHVYLDSFYSLTGQEHAVLRRIMSEAECFSATVPLPHPTYRGIDTASIKNYSDKLRSDAAGFGGEVETVTLGENHRPSSQTLKLLTEKLWRMDEDIDTDELFKAQTAAEQLRGQIKGYLDQASKAQAEASELKREIFRLQQKLEGLSCIKLYLEQDDTVNLQKLEALSKNQGFNFTVQKMANTDWSESWKENYPPQPVGNQLLVLPYWLSDADTEGRLPVILDPGLTFGTGAHPSTQMVMEQMEQLQLQGKTCLDLGSGSGILSITGLRLGAKKAVGVDIDQKAENIANWDNAVRVWKEYSGFDPSQCGHW